MLKQYNFFSYKRLLFLIALPRGMQGVNNPPSLHRIASLECVIMQGRGVCKTLEMGGGGDFFDHTLQNIENAGNALFEKFIRFWKNLEEPHLGK